MRLSGIKSLTLLLGALLLVVFVATNHAKEQYENSVEQEPTGDLVLTPKLPTRAQIADRQGRVLATNLAGYSLYALPDRVVSPQDTARQLTALFPELEYDLLHRQLDGTREFIWIKRFISQFEAEKVRKIGEPGLLVGAREQRFYPNADMASHVLGGSGFGREGVSSAEIVGVAGVEKSFDDVLRRPERSEIPLVLSLDLAVQAEMESILERVQHLGIARRSAAVLLSVKDGEVIALASLPDFDPNNRPRPFTTGSPAESPLFNAAVQGAYEMGSVLSVFTVARALEIGLIEPDSKIDVATPLRSGRFEIKVVNSKKGEITPKDILSSNSRIGSARLGSWMGSEELKYFFEELGFAEPLDFEVYEAQTSAPLLPIRWSELSSMTASYGHGIAITPLHLAAAYSTVANDGVRIQPTLIRRSSAPAGLRVFSSETAAKTRELLRASTLDGIAKSADIFGYEVAASAALVEKATDSGYSKDSLVAVFAGMFPYTAPRYVLVVLFDELGSGMAETNPVTPIAAEIIRHSAPHLNLKPQMDFTLDIQ